MKNMIEMTKQAEVLDTVTESAETIKQQKGLKQAVSTFRNVSTLAGNDERLVSVIRRILDWMLILHSSAVCRREEYAELTEQMIGLAEDKAEGEMYKEKLNRTYEEVKKRGQREKIKAVWLAVVTIVAVLGCIF